MFANANFFLYNANFYDKIEEENIRYITDYRKKRKLEKIREADEKIRVLVVEPMKEPKVEYIENTLDDMQRVVGGLIEEIDLDNNTVLVCNEEGKLMNLQANRRVGRDVIAGTFFIAGDDGSEDLVSLTDEQVNEYKERFHELEEIEQQEVFEKIEITIRGFKNG